MARLSSPISSKGQITISADIRAKKGIKPADRFEFVDHKDGILLRPTGPGFVELAGSVPALRGRENVDLETIIQEAREDHANESAERFCKG